MAITVGELVEQPLLKIRLHAGAMGADRGVTWAHSCELPNPWDWMGPGDLLMCNGLGIPQDPAGQAAYLESLAAARLSGILIGEDQHAPPLSDEMLGVAERHGFPVLFNAYEVPFVAVARAVADANAREEQARLVRTVRLYDLVRAAAAEGQRGPELVERVGVELDARLYLLDPVHGVDLMPGVRPAPDPLRSALVRGVAERGGMVTSVVRLAHGDATAVAVPVPAAEPAMLVAEPRRGRPPALALLQHVALVAALELEKLSLERETTRRLSAELLSAMVEGRIDRAAAADRMRDHGFEEGPLVLVACRPSPEHERHLHRRLAERAVPHLLLLRGLELLVLVPAAPQTVGILLEELGTDALVGMSDVVQGLGRLADAAREARWALAAAGTSDGGSVRYGEMAPLFMPRTISEARAAVSRVLGDLIEYDAEHGTELLKSLEVFLECNRSWQRASEQLVVHKQTVVYRMRRVEELSGRSLDSTADVSELWLALQARRSTAEPKLIAPAR